MYLLHLQRSGSRHARGGPQQPAETQNKSQAGCALARCPADTEGDDGKRKCRGGHTPKPPPVLRRPDHLFHLRERHQQCDVPQGLARESGQIWERTLVSIRPLSLGRRGAHRHATSTHRNVTALQRLCRDPSADRDGCHLEFRLSFLSSTGYTKTLHFPAGEVVWLWAALDPFPAGRTGDNL